MYLERNNYEGNAKDGLSAIFSTHQDHGTVEALVLHVKLYSLLQVRLLCVMDFEYQPATKKWKID